jgi:hypothetical protein
LRGGHLRIFLKYTIKGGFCTKSYIKRSRENLLVCSIGIAQEFLRFLHSIGIDEIPKVPIQLFIDYLGKDMSGEEKKKVPGKK